MSEKLENYVITEYLVFCVDCDDECRDTEKKMVIRNAVAKAYTVIDNETVCGRCALERNDL